MTKNKIREKLIDICNGAGYYWIDDDNYFECQDDHGKCIARVLQGIEKSFDFPSDTRLRMPWQLEKTDSIDDLVGLVQEVFDYDIKT